MVTTKKTVTTKPATTVSKPKKGAKAQKAPVKRGISDELIPIEEETWLLQPIAVTMMRHDYSLIQVRILVSIVESLQSILHGILNNKRSPQLDLFKTKELDEDGRMPIKLPFKELGVDPNHYPQLRTSLKMLAAIPVEIPYKTSEGRKYTKATNLCDVYIPEDRSYNKYAILKLDRSVAERLVSLDFGYHRLGKQIVFACKNRYTQRIYMFIESWVDKGRTVIKTLEFRKMLRLENNYKKFSDFCRRVLEPAKQELKELADKGFCDCYFDYEKKYDHGQRGGEPDELVFQIFRAKNKMDAQLEQMNEMQRRQFQQMLIQYFDFTQPNAKSMAERITAELYPLAMQKLMDLRQRFNTTYVKDKAAYTFKSLDQMIREHDIPNTTVEEIKD
ncbi:MAG: replication initiation protein [Prevotella nigrescens]|jgi:initiator repB protein|uniref:replication initiation protein n=1 Tax=Prevotella nigrescens TaxID=28133 RepID=UPI001BA5C1E9|nr:replication initiation protein [Prevotella nigrescens]MBF1444129.1 replication initiation protein [Prevotella nigrescens]QUB50990.1 replication initiation protein [Prevotella nigrescens]